MNLKDIRLRIKLIPFVLISVILATLYRHGIDVVYEWNKFKIGFYNLIWGEKQ